MRTRLIESVFRHAEAFAAGDRAGKAPDADLYRAFLRDGRVRPALTHSLMRLPTSCLPWIGPTHRT
jgi:hypothetical protein